MSNINILIRKLAQDKYFFPIFLVGYFVVYSFSLNSIPFGDDFVYLFKNWHITDASNPFVYWNLKSDSYKAWPLTYSIFWFLYRAFDDSYFFYRIVNLSIHFFNSWLFFKIAQSFRVRTPKLLFLIFLFHPMCFESIFWIFQLKTLLSTTFLFISLRFALKERIDSKIIIYTFIPFFLSLYTKSVAIFFPFILLYIWRNKKSSRLYLIPFFILSFYVGVQNIKGITATPGNTIRVEDFYKNENISNEGIDSTQRVINIIHERKSYSLINKYSEYVKAYIESIDSTDVIIGKINHSITNYIFYLRSTFGLVPNWLVHKLTYSKMLVSISILFFILLLIIAVCLKTFRFSFLASILFFIPISGFFYVPYMEFSPVAEHWFYTSLSFTLLMISNLITSKRYSQIIFTTLFFVSTIALVQQSLNLRNTKDYFYKNLSYIPDSAILYEYLIESEKRDLNFKQALVLTEEIIPITKNKYSIIKNQIYLASKMNNKDLVRKYQKNLIHFLFAVGNYQQLHEEAKNLQRMDKDLLFIKFLLKLKDNDVSKDEIEKIKKILFH